LARWVDANRPYLQEVEPLEQAFDGAEMAIQGMVCGGIDQMRVAETLMRERGFQETVSMHRTEYPLRDLSMLDLLPPGCSKGTALHQLAVSLGIDRSEIMAIGDNLNDLEMLEYAGHPVVMRNAGEQMLAIAGERGWTPAATNDEDGVALILEELLASHERAQNGETSSVAPASR
jgi:hydroxymethylpyrimidine pyrophosphatase-like HAD family hydrolase